MQLRSNERRLMQAQSSRKMAVFQIIRAAILDGRLAAGERLNQDKIAAELGVSRMPVREALKSLETEGLVRFYPYRGVEVAELDPADIEEMFGIRSALEQLAIGRAVERLSGSDLNRMRRVLERMDQWMEAGEQDVSEWMMLNADFHALINRASGWPKLVEIIDLYRANVDRYVRMYLSIMGRSQPQAEHWALYEACKRRDCAAAQQLIAEHLSHTAIALLEALTTKSTMTPALPIGAKEEEKV